MEKPTYTKSLRDFRKYHKYFGIALSVFLFISALTGLLLGWKKDVDLLQPPTQTGASADLSRWKPLSELAETARAALYAQYPDQTGNAIDRIDARPGKGIIKVLFEKGWWEVQLDSSSGEVLSVARRHSDWIEALHDGSIISDFFKLIAMNALGLGLLLMVLTGLWLWYGPVKLRRMKRRRGG